MEVLSTNRIINQWNHCMHVVEADSLSLKLNQDWIPTGMLWDMDNYKGHWPISYSVS